MALLGTTLASGSSSSSAAPGRLAGVSPGTALPPAPTGSDWPTYLGENSRDSANAGASGLSPSDAARLTQLWNFTIGVADPGFLQAEPVEVGNTVYVGGGNGVFYAINGTTGAEVWQSPNLGTDSQCTAYADGITSSATVTGGEVYVGGGNGYFYALNQATGNVDWQFFVGPTSQGYYNWASPLVLPNLGYVYIGVSSDCDHPLVIGGLDQVSLSTHKLVHFFSDLSLAQEANCNPTPGPPWVENSSSDCGASIWGSPSYDAATNTVWAATGNGYALSLPEYGDSLMEWNATTLALISHWTIPNADQIYDGDFGTTPTIVNPPGGPPMVFVTNKNGWSYALDRDDIAKGPVWQYMVSTSNETYAPDAYGGGLIYISGHGTNIGPKHYPGSIRAFNPLVNKTVWALGMPGEVFGAPVYANGLVVVVGGDVLDVLDASTGDVLYSYTATGPFLAAPSIAGGVIYVEDSDGLVLAFGLKNTARTYGVSFEEDGLPPGAQWWVNVTGGPSTSSTATTLSFLEPNGTYDYTVATSDKVYASAGGSFTVHGKMVSESATFTLVTFPVEFTESGLPNGTRWYVNITGGRSESSTGSTISFTEPNGSYDYTVSTLNKEYASAGGSFTVHGKMVSETAIFSLVTYPVELAESGLPNGTTWYVNLTGGLSLNSTGSTLSFREPNGTYDAAIVSADTEYSAPLTPFTVMGAASTVNVTFTLVTSEVTLSEEGLPAGTPWWVNVTGGASTSSITSSLSFPEPNGTYDYTVATADKDYAPALSSGSFGVRGATVHESEKFNLVSYAVSFSETGLPSGTAWSVTLGGILVSSTTTTLSSAQPNGTHSYTITDLPGWHETTLAYSGLLAVSGADAPEPTMAFTEVTYSTAFTESGLPTGTEWWVNLTNGEKFNSTAHSLSFVQPNGTYEFTMATTDKEYASAGGSFTVDELGVSETVTFTLVTYTVTFTETGLPSGTNWTVTLDGTLRASTASTITFTEPNETYLFTVGSLPGYSVNRTNGSITVNGAALERPVFFATVPGTATIFGLPPMEGYLLLGGIGAVGLLWAIVGLVLLRDRRKASPGAGTPASPSGAGSPPVPP